MYEKLERSAIHGKEGCWVANKRMKIFKADIEAGIEGVAKLKKEISDLKSENAILKKETALEPQNRGDESKQKLYKICLGNRREQFFAVLERENLVLKGSREFTVKDEEGYNRLRGIINDFSRS